MSWVLIAVLLLVCISCAFVVAAIVYRAVGSGRRISSHLLLDGPVPGWQLSKVTPSSLPTGRAAATMSFWMYIDSFDTPPGVPKHVLHRGDLKAMRPIVNGPSVYIDGQRNALNIAFRPVDPSLDLSTDLGSVTDADRSALATDNALAAKLLLLTRGITIDHVPSQRWFHVAVAVDTRERTIKAYVDGEQVRLSSGSSSLTLPSGASYNVPTRYDDIDPIGAGDFHIGGHISTPVGPGFRGFLSSVRFADGALRERDVYALYKRGPIEGSVAARLGMPAYGLRWPVYRVAT